MKIDNYKDLVKLALGVDEVKDGDITVSINSGVDLSDDMTPEFADEVRTLLRQEWDASRCPR